MKVSWAVGDRRVKTKEIIGIKLLPESDGFIALTADNPEKIIMITGASLVEVTGHIITRVNGLLTIKPSLELE